MFIREAVGTRGFWAALAYAALAGAFLSSNAHATVSFLAVAAGDATSDHAVIWTRAKDPASALGASLTAQVSTDPGFGAGTFPVNGLTTDPTHDYTVHVDVGNLQSGTRYYYRFVASDGAVSPVGTFATAPDPSAHVPLKFGFTGDADGLMRPYDATDDFTSTGVPSFAQQGFDFFVWLGDTIYETASGLGGPNASAAAPDTSVAANISTTAALSTMQQAYWAKYRQQFLPVSSGAYPGLQSFFASTGHYTLLDNHELGNKQVINGGAAPGTNPAGIGVDPTNGANDVNASGTFMNQAAVFKTLVQAYTDYQPIRVSTVNSPGDDRSNGTQRMYFSQRWGANSVFFNLDDRSYRDIRLKKPGTTTDDTGVRADNLDRTMLGQTQLNWLQQGLLDAQAQHTTWKFIAISSPIDQIGAIGSGADGGKSWMGGYRVERNRLIKFIADNHIDNVVFLSTDDHQVRINELGYFTQFDTSNTPIQSSYVRAPKVFEIVAGPIGATGPDAITDHSFANVESIAKALASQQTAAGVDPIGLDPNYPGLHDVMREGDAQADSVRAPVDFYSPDTFNYATLEVDSCPTLSVGLFGINSYAVNTFPQPSAANPVRQLLAFKIDADDEPPAIQSVGATPSLLWPPNHKMVPVQLMVAATDNCGIATEKIVAVTSSEPSDGIGDGHTSPDWQITGDLTLQLRAERSGAGGGRVYTITVELTDTSGNKARRTVDVFVPKSKS
jgi:phosphodiesterase/alkaline phosphatase D-like protein